MILDRQSSATPTSPLAATSTTDLKFCGRLHSDLACHRQMNTPLRLVNLLSLYHGSHLPRSRAASWAAWCLP